MNDRPENGYQDLGTLLVDLMFYAPLGFAAKRAGAVSLKISKRSQEIAVSGNSAKLIGRFAMATAKQKTARLLSSAVSFPAENENAAPTADKTGEPAVAHSASYTSPDAAQVIDERESQVSKTGGDAVGESDLPIRGYDTLAASQIIKKLDSLDGNELRVIRQYESGKRSRRTILAKIDHLIQSFGKGGL